MSTWDRVQACHSAMRKCTACLELGEYADALVNLLCAVVHLTHVADQDKAIAIVREEVQRRQDLAATETQPW